MGENKTIHMVCSVEHCRYSEYTRGGGGRWDELVENPIGQPTGSKQVTVGFFFSFLFFFGALASGDQDDTRGIQYLEL